MLLEGVGGRGRMPRVGGQNVTGLIILQDSDITCIP